MTQQYKNMAIQELSRHSALRSSLNTLPGQIARLEQELTSPRDSLARAGSVGGGGPSTAQDWLTAGLERKSRMERSLAAARQSVQGVEYALEALNEKEQRVLQEFYICRERGHMERLCRELGVEEASVYRLKNKALEKFTLALYGPEEGGLPS